VGKECYVWDDRPGFWTCDAKTILWGSDVSRQWRNFSRATTDTPGTPLPVAWDHRGVPHTATSSVDAVTNITGWRQYWKSCQWPGDFTSTNQCWNKECVYGKVHDVRDEKLTDLYQTSLMIGHWTCYVLRKFLVRFSTPETWRNQESRAIESLLASDGLVICNMPFPLLACISILFSVESNTVARIIYT
jgi:hypothetical protein